MYTTRQDAIDQAIIPAIENGGAADAADFDLEAIFETCFEYSAELGGFVQTAGEPEFWDAVQAAAHDEDGGEHVTVDSSAGDGVLSEIMAAHAAALRLQDEMRDAAAARDDLVRRAVKAGVGVQVIADALGLARQRIYAMAR